jgi:hypothetical protein
MSAAPAPLLDLLSWLDARPRSYREAIEAWRSSCPRLSVWDDALTAGLIRVVRHGGPMDDAEVALSDSGRTLLTASAGGHSFAANS